MAVLGRRSLVVSRSQTTCHTSSFIFMCRRHKKYKNERGGVKSGLAMHDYVTCANNDNKTDDYNDLCLHILYTCWTLR